MTHDHRQAPSVHLTPRQLEVLSLLCEGLPNKLICRQLNISTGTVKVHIGCILRELGVSSRLQAVVAAQRCGLFGEFAVRTPEQAVDSTPGAKPRLLPVPQNTAYRAGWRWQPDRLVPDAREPDQEAVSE